MNLCVNCGVELDDGLKVCPLCGKDPEKESEEVPVSDGYPSVILQFQKKENRNYYWELSGIIAFSGIVGCTIIDLLISKGLNWSLLSDVSIAAAWVILTIYQFLYRKVYIMVLSLLLTILAALFLIDLIATGRDWFFPVALPTAVTLFFVVTSVYFLYKLLHFKGLDIIASSIIALSVFCIILEAILDKYIHGIVNIRWSLIVAVSIFPVALVLFYYHFRLKKGKQLDSFFHV